MSACKIFDKRTGKQFNSQKEYEDFYSTMRPDTMTPTKERLEILFDAPSSPFYSQEEEMVSVFSKFIALKERQLIDYKNRLGKVKVDKKAKNLSQAEFEKLNKLQRDFENKIEGNSELGIKGLVTEIAELKASSNINAVGYYVEKDLARIAELVSSDSLEDLKEAEYLIEFYDAAGTFIEGVNNPFFFNEEVFIAEADGSFSTEYLPHMIPVIEQFQKWRDVAKRHGGKLEEARKTAIIAQVNNNANVKNTVGDNKVTSESLFPAAGLADTDYLSMWTMDFSQGIFSHNGLAPQAMWSILFNNIEKEKVWEEDTHEKINELIPKVEKELAKLGYTLSRTGILGLSGSSFDIFKEKTRQKNYTGGLIRKFTKDFYDLASNARNTFYKNTKRANLESDFTAREQIISKAFDAYKDWRIRNTIVLDVNRLSDPTYLSSIEAIVGKDALQEYIKEQNTLINKYNADRKDVVEKLYEKDSVTTEDELSDTSKTSLKLWELSNSPENGVKDYDSISGLKLGSIKRNSWGNYNVYIPRANKVNVSKNTVEDKFVTTDTTEKTGHYNEDFATIENNPVLYEFYKVARDVSEKIASSLPYSEQSINNNSLPGLEKTFLEIVADKRMGRLESIFEGLKYLWDKIRLSLGSIRQSEYSVAKLDKNNRPNYKVNSNFLSNNNNRIKQFEKLERIRFLQYYNSDKLGNSIVNKIERFSSFPFSKMNTEALNLLADYLNVPRGDIAAIKAITGEKIEIAKYIREYSTHSIVKEQTTDLPKVLKFFSTAVAGYNARERSLPVLELMKKYYEELKKPHTNNFVSQIFNKAFRVPESQGLRNNGIMQMDDQFNRVMLNNYSKKKWGFIGAKVQEVKDENGKVVTHTPTIGAKIFTRQEKARIREIDELLSSNKISLTSEGELREIKASFGSERNVADLLEGLFVWVRLLKLGWNLSSAITNFLEGIISNVTLASNGNFFDPKDLNYGYSVARESFVKNTTFGLATTKNAKKNRILMDRYRVAIDSANELQKSSIKTYSSRLSWLNPLTHTRRVEYLNQSPLMIAMLRSTKLTGIDGTESSVWDALDENGKLTDNFKTEQNINDWENRTGDGYLVFKQKLNKVIGIGHGLGYDELRGMAAKSHDVGRIFSMFKTWLPSSLFWRFAPEQVDIQLGGKFKGRYRSHTAASGFLHGTVIGAAAFGFTVAPIIGIAGMGIAKAFGVQTNIDILHQTLDVTKVLVKKMVGMPINAVTNLVAGKTFIKEDRQAFENWITNDTFTKEDAANLRANISDITLQLVWIAMALMVKSMFWDDDDKPEEEDRIVHNLLINRLMNLSQQGTMFVDPSALWAQTMKDNAIFRYLDDLKKEVVNLQKWADGEDIMQSGINIGKSGLAIQTKKTLLPGIFKDENPLILLKGELPGLGFKSQAESVFQEYPFHNKFKSEKTKEKESNKRERAAYKLEIQDNYNIEDYEDEAEMKKEMQKEIDAKYPTPTQLNKLGLSRDEYEEQQDEE